MRKAVFVVGAMAGLLGACSAPTDNPEGNIPELPEGVLAIVAPYQDLTSVRINEADGCYEYLHAGPVESTYLPLRTADGRPICTRAKDEPAPTS